jgi:putative transposase
MRNFKFKLYPTKKQVRLLDKQLELCRQVYNSFLEQKKVAWEQNKVSLSAYDLIKTLPGAKEANPELKNVYADSLQNLGLRLDKAFKGFFSRIKKGDKPGYPRFKSKGRLTSIHFPRWTSGINVVGKNKVKVSKIGLIKFVQHRQFPTPKNATIKKCGNDWFLIVCCDIDIVKTLPSTGNRCAIDVGVENFLTKDNGEVVANPRFFEVDQKALAKAQQKGRKDVVIKIHKRIANKRNDFAWKTALTLIKENDVICIEDLNINKMIQKRWCSKQICDAAWGDFLRKLDFKAVEAGRRVIKVNPAYTSQTCSQCGARQTTPLQQRMFSCSCGFSLSRDHNAALNILAVGLYSLVFEPRSPDL